MQLMTLARWIGGPQRTSRLSSPLISQGAFLIPRPPLQLALPGSRFPSPAWLPCLSACAAWNRRLVDFSACSSPVSLSHSSSLIKINIDIAISSSEGDHVNFKQVKLSNIITSGRPTSQTVVGLVGRGDVEISAAAILHSLAFGQLLSARSDFLSDSPYKLSLPQPRSSSAAVAIR
jgi:hypothetical protein